MDRVQVIVREPAVAEGIAFIAAAGAFGPAALSVRFEYDDGRGHVDTASLTGLTPNFGEVFGGCDDVRSVLRACLRTEATSACETAWGGVYVGLGECVSFNAFEGFEEYEDPYDEDLFFSRDV